MTQPRTASAADMAVLAISLIMAGVGAWIVFAGPTELMPIHWGPDGTADDWAGREIVGGVVVGLGLLTLLLGLGMGMAAGRADDPARKRGLRVAQLIVLIIVPLIALLGASASLSGATSIAGGVPMAGTSAVLLLLGAVLGRVGPNPFVGVRTPWAYKSKLAWERSNRLAGRLFFLLGLGGIATAAFAPQPFGLYAIVAGALISGVLAVVESWRVWRTDPDRQPF